MTTRMLQRRGLASEWAATDPILSSGEIGFIEDTGEIRIGDGVTPFEKLTSPYVTKVEAVLSVAGRTGNVVLTPPDIPGVYYAGNLPPYPVTSVAGRGGAVVLTASDVAAGSFPAGTYTFTGASSVIAGDGTAAPAFRLNGTTGSTKIIDFQSAGLSRWKIQIYNVESGGNSGSDYSLRRFDDSGTLIDIPLSIARSTGIATLTNNVSFPNTKGLLLSMTSGNQGYVIGSGTVLQLRGGTGGYNFRNNADTQSTLIIADNGNISAPQGTTHTFNGPGSVIFEIGRQDGVSSTPGLDFHSGATAVDFDVRLLASTGTGVSGGGSLYGYMNDFVLDLGNTGTRRFRFNSDATWNYIQSDHPIAFTPVFSSVVRAKINTDGSIESHGTGSGLLLFGRDNDTQNFVNYVNGNTWRIYSSTAGADRLTVDINGTLTIKNVNLSALALSVDSSVNTRGPEIAFVDTKAGQTTPNKFIRANGGILQFLNNSYTTAILSLDDNGNLVANNSVSAPIIQSSGMAGAQAGSRYVGATTSGAPVTGTFAVGDWVVDRTGKMWVCTVAGSPGTWTQAGSSASITVKSILTSNNVGNAALVTTNGPAFNAWSQASAGLTITCGASGIIDLDYTCGLCWTSSVVTTNRASAYVTAAQSSSEANGLVGTGGISSQFYTGNSVAYSPVTVSGRRRVTGLTPGTNYTFYVWATSDNNSNIALLYQTTNGNVPPWAALKATTY